VTTGLDRARQVGQGDDRAGLWRRLRRAAELARLDRSERQVARFLQENGGRLTDDLERRILDRDRSFDRGGFY
jgi:hypothetical protein